MKSILYFLFLLALSINAQQIKGRVIDAKTSEPLEGASIYLEGTTYGTISNTDGNFTLTTRQILSSPLVITFLGYSDVVVNPSWNQPMLVEMQQESESLNEVIVRANPIFSRKELLKAFKREFLGTSPGGLRTKISNDEVIDIWFDETSNELKASSNFPIDIKNDYLGYLVRYTLQDFRVKFYSTSLASEERELTSYQGKSFFVDFSRGKRRFNKRRKKLFIRSSLNLMRIIGLEDWKKRDFKFYNRGFETNPELYFEVENDPIGKKVSLSKELIVTDKDKKQSGIIPKGDYFFIDGYGNIYPPDAIMYSGALGQQRVGDMLPLNYGLD